MSSWGLGNKFDVLSVIPVIADIAAGANTGHRIHMRNYEGVAFVFHKGVASAGTDTVTLTVKQHNANTGGTSADLVAIDTFYMKSEASLDGDEVWTETTQTAAATVALTNAVLPAANQGIVVVQVMAEKLSAGYEWVSLDIADPGSGGTIPGTVLAIAFGLKFKRLPSLSPQPNA